MGGDHYTVGGFAVPETLNLLHDLLARAGEEHPDVPSADLMMFELAVIELVGNLVEHGRPTGEVQYAFILQIEDHCMVGTLSDTGDAVAYDPEVPMPHEMDVEGRGLPLARAALDGLTYSREEGANHWRMVRKRSSTETEL
jgi:serine/threonine-protein kinase RsbW